MLSTRHFALADTQLIMHVFHAGDTLRNVFRQPLGAPLVDVAGECYFTIVHLDFDLAGIDVRVLRQALADVLPNAIVRSLIALRPPPGETPVLLAGYAGAARIRVGV